MIIVRRYEQFFYSHQQLVRRANVEREVAGLERIKPLDPRAMNQSLGPGYKGGYLESG